MTHTALRTIRAEHEALSAMLQSLALLVKQQHRDGTPPPFEVMRAMLFYIDEFPERLHHRKESDLLFPLLRQRGADCAQALDKLDRDHAAGERAIRQLEHALLAYEMLGEARRGAFEDALASYLDFYRAHMRLEEDVVLPAAEAVLTEADWATLDAAFGENRDPLTGHAPGQVYEKLFRHIVHTAPAPIGLG
jgi:hemerythrin-like domain-containing protein